MLVFAYDGSLNGDWVAHYAVRFAVHTPERRLLLVHVHPDAAPPSPRLRERIARIAAECRRVDVEIEARYVTGSEDAVTARLLEAVPPGATLVAGARARPRRQTFLAGTVSARLLASARFPVVAIRVAQPGLLGQPGRVLLPLSHPERDARDAVPLLRLLGADLHRLHVLHVSEVSRLRHRFFLSSGSSERLSIEGRALTARAEAALRAGLEPLRFELDASVVVSDDTAREIRMHAGKDRSRLVLLGASERASRLAYRSTVERVLREAPCDVAVHGGAP